MGSSVSTSRPIQSKELTRETSFPRTNPYKEQPSMSFDAWSSDSPFYDFINEECDEPTPGDPPNVKASAEPQICNEDSLPVSGAATTTPSFKKQEDDYTLEDCLEEYEHLYEEHRKQEKELKALQKEQDQWLETLECWHRTQTATPRSPSVLSAPSLQQQQQATPPQAQLLTAGRLAAQRTHLQRERAQCEQEVRQQYEQQRRYSAQLQSYQRQILAYQQMKQRRRQQQQQEMISQTPRKEAKETPRPQEGKEVEEAEEKQQRQEQLRREWEERAARMHAYNDQRQRQVEKQRQLWIESQQYQREQWILAQQQLQQLQQQRQQQQFSIQPPIQFTQQQQSAPQVLPRLSLPQQPAGQGSYQK